MSAFPKNVSIKIGKSVHETTIVDADTGDGVPCVKALKVELDSEKARPDVEIILCGVEMTISAEEARYVLDEETLRRLAADNGFDLVAKP